MRGSKCLRWHKQSEIEAPLQIGPGSSPPGCILDGSVGRSGTRPVHGALAAYKVGPTVMPAETILLSHTWYSLSSMLRVMGWAGTSELLE